MEIVEFLEKLSSSEPVPGGGGVCALLGAVGSALCSMVANLTSGKKKYAQYQCDIDRIIGEAEKKTQKIFSMIEEDAKAFYPLSQAYSIPKDAPGRDETLEDALKNACSVPYDILVETYFIVPIMEELLVKGSRLVLSDVGVAAASVRSAIESAAMNVYINTKLMKNIVEAERINAETDKIFADGIERCDDICDKVIKELRKR